MRLPIRARLTLVSAALMTAVLVGLAAASIAAAAAIGVVVAARSTLWLLLFVVCGAFFAVAYNLELLGGRFHGDVWFALAWGAFPLATAYVATAEKLDAVVAAEAPRLSPHIPAMCAHLAEMLGLPPGRVSVKATTTEGLGFVGTRDGIAAYATACVAHGGFNTVPTME